MKININRDIYQQRNNNKIKYQKKENNKGDCILQAFKLKKKKKIQTKPKSAKLKLNLINTTIEQNRTQEIVKNKWEIREKGRQTLNLN